MSDWSSGVCASDLVGGGGAGDERGSRRRLVVSRGVVTAKDDAIVAGFRSIATVHHPAEGHRIEDGVKAIEQQRGEPVARRDRHGPDEPQELEDIGHMRPDLVGKRIPQTPNPWVLGCTDGEGHCTLTDGGSEKAKRRKSC